jgi:hypothetical protein
MIDRKTMDDFERGAEVAYAGMHDAKPHGVKDCYDDAMLCFAHAIEAARLAVLVDEVQRLKSRVEHIRNVYDGQFRGVGR